MVAALLTSLTDKRNNRGQVCTIDKYLWLERLRVKSSFVTFYMIARREVCVEGVGKTGGQVFCLCIRVHSGSNLFCLGIYVEVNGLGYACAGGAGGFLTSQGEINPGIA
jgi:hypothetical protein